MGPEVILAAEALAGLFNGLSQASVAARTTKEQARQFNIQSAPNTAQRAQMAPLRDRLVQIMGARFGANPTTYAAAQKGYAPSQDLSDQQSMYRRMMQQMGYPQASGPSPATPEAPHYHNPNDPNEFDEERGW